MNPAMGLRVDLHSLTIPNATLLHTLQLTVPPGVVHTVMGASGSGKSSLLLAVCGALPEGLAFQGTITLNGQRLEHLPPQAPAPGQAWRSSSSNSASDMLPAACWPTASNTSSTVTSWP